MLCGKKNVIVLVLTIGLFMMSGNVAFADCSDTVCVGTIERLYINSLGVLYIASDGDESNLDCTSPAGKYVTLLPTDENFDRKYAMMLTAMSLEKNVGLRVVTGSSQCELSYVYMDD